MKLSDLVLATGASLRLTRLVTTDVLLEWAAIGKLRREAEVSELVFAQRVEEARLRDRPVTGEPDWTHYPPDGGPYTWRGRLVKGLDCPFCVGFWIGLGVLVSRVAVDRHPRMRSAWRTVMGGLALNYLVGHVSSRLDE